MSCTQATLIIFDIGINTLEVQGDKNFFQRSKECITRIIERKIMSQENELIGIILMGSNKIDLNSELYKNIEIFNKLQAPSWEMIRNLPNKPTQSSNDWFSALIDATTYFTTAVKSNKTKLIEKRIVIFTNFLKSTHINQDEIQKALEEFIKQNYRIDVIGCTVNSENCMTRDIHTVKKILETTNGISESFDQAMKEFIFYKKKIVTGNAWNVDLCIGNIKNRKIKIPVSCYLRVKTIKNDDFLKKWKHAVRDPITGKASNSQTVGKKTQYFDEANNIIKPENILEGYQYGEAIIPLSELDKPLLYKSGPVSIDVYGFTAASNIKLETLNHDTLMYIYGQKGCKNANFAIKCLAQCLMDSPNLVGIARVVKKENKSARMYALFPVQEEDFICLSMVSICFKEEIKCMAFPSTESAKFDFTLEQVDAFKDFIKNMDLDRDNNELDEYETFQIGEVPSPSVQHIFDAIVNRAKNPGEPLPPPRPDVMKLFEALPSLRNYANNSLQKLKSLFVLNYVKNKDGINLSSNNLDVSDSAINDDKDITKAEQLDTVYKYVYNIGTVNPVNDLKLCLSEGKNFHVLEKEMTDAIEILIYSDLDERQSKALEAISFLRTEAVKSDPSFYNNWLKNLKSELVLRERNDIINLLKDNKIDYILNDENKLSTITFENKDIYEVDTMEYFEENSVPSDVDELFNNM
ncbi:X-ray repair cross-complementing protein 5 [Battus philenor]|uniref:X-ray repair cross-complementing protein 5 n=1 Tax=Battus philenor TaxID=42288 RepID=UPI0035CF17EA